MFAASPGDRLLYAQNGSSKTEGKNKQLLTKGDWIRATSEISVVRSPGGKIKGRQFIGRNGTVIEIRKRQSNVLAHVDWQTGIDGWCDIEAIEISPVDWEHGNAQVKALLRDRPEMASFKNANGKLIKLSKDDTIWKNSARFFGTRISGQRIFWDPTEPDKSNGYAADHTIPRPGVEGKIRLRPRTWLGSKKKWVKLSFGRGWSTATFEMLNIMNSSEFIRLYEKALAGEISRADYVEQNQRLEYIALAGLKEYFQKEFSPWATAHGYTTTRSERFSGFRVSLPDTYEAWIGLYPGGGYSYFFDYFDKTVVPYLKATNRFDPKKHSPPKKKKTNSQH